MCPSDIRRTPAVGWATTILVILFTSGACGSRGGATDNPGTPAPATAGAGPGTTSPPQADPSGDGVGGLPAGQAVPVRPDQAPLVSIQDALDADSLLGRRVRVAGRCTAAGAGRRAGSWTLAEAGLTIEVRGLVPYSCGPNSTTNLTIFAQIEPKASGSSERLLLRLPD